MVLKMIKLGNFATLMNKLLNMANIVEVIIGGKNTQFYNVSSVDCWQKIG